MFSYDGISTCLNITTWSTNHSSLPNVKKELVVDGPDLKAIKFVAVADIMTGDELLIDYREFNFPHFFKEFAAKNSFWDVRSIIIGAD